MVLYSRGCRTDPLPIFCGPAPAGYHGGMLEIPPLPRRRWIQFGLRTVLPLVTVLVELLGISTSESARRIYYGFTQEDMERMEDFPTHIPLMMGERIVGYEYVGEGKANIVTSPPSDHSIRHKLRARKLEDGNWSLDQAWTVGEVPFFREEATK
jgi:hypothetical protein